MALYMFSAYDGLYFLSIIFLLWDFLYEVIITLHDVPDLTQLQMSHQEVSELTCYCVSFSSS